MENIKKHYDKYGNTNLITESGLSNNVFAIGDSHSIFFHNSMRIIEHWGHCLTMYSLINNRIDINNLGNILKNGHEKYNINEKDVVIFFLGYNDVQKYFCIHGDDDKNKYISTIVLKYVESVREISDIYKIQPIISCVYPIPINHTSLSIKGTDVQRIEFTKICNENLRKRCVTNKIPFLDTYDKISLNDRIRHDYTVDGVHLDYNNERIREYIEGYIFELIYKFNYSIPNIKPN